MIFLARIQSFLWVVGESLRALLNWVSEPYIGFIGALFGFGLIPVLRKNSFRRPILAFQFVVVGLLLTIMAVLMRFEGLAVEISIQACALIAYGLMATNFTCIILYSAEALPTQFRASGSGILHASCRPGSIIGMQLLKFSYNLVTI